MEAYIPYILIVVGAAILGYLVYIAFRASSSTSWPKTSGVLLSKGKQLHVSRDLTSHEKHVTWKSLHIDVEYEYEVDGVRYVSSRVTFSDMVNKPVSALDRVLDEYLSSDQVTVHYNPKDPSDSALHPGLRVWNFTPMITGILFIGAGVFLLYQ